MISMMQVFPFPKEKKLQSGKQSLGTHLKKKVWDYGVDVRNVFILFISFILLGECAVLNIIRKNKMLWEQHKNVAQ